MVIPTQFQAYVVHKDDQGFRSGIETCSWEQLPEGDVTINVQYSSVNYKDGLASLPDGDIVRRYPFIPGIDLAGTVVHSAHASFHEGDQVLCTGYGLGVSHEGGFSQYARLNGDWLLHLPQSLTPKEAMGIGTAGFTAALSIHAMLNNGLRPEHGPVLVTGATGGVGSFAISILSRLGYEVIASTGKLEEQKDWLQSLGAHQVISRDELHPPKSGVMSSERWSGVVDPVGGGILPELLKQIRYGGSAALSGLTGGTEFNGTVFPFILRGIKLLGIDSVNCSMMLRKEIWGRLAAEWKPETMLGDGIKEVALTELPEALNLILRGKAVGRSVVVLNPKE
ncbi:acryloyl-CoA reductase [Paenibacillus lemnae]|uniref:Acryloyl-CoA reductase n=1 Tax=Paenibacillus lemnae TaxID=1330551 RepID=A0A848M7R6_PAELE|nr:acryloyl-CoA reductase [Paenibacillus lemnae]NMO96251.1 acryloyl-CoA reductase [Paenibacillus lemnae]